MKNLVVWGTGIPFFLVLNFFIYDLSNYVPKKLAFIVLVVLMFICILSMSIFVVFQGRTDIFSKNKKK